MGNRRNHVSIYLCYLLWHNPQSIGLDMDCHGWVDAAQLIDKVNAAGKHSVDVETIDSP